MIWFKFLIVSWTLMSPVLVNPTFASDDEETEKLLAEGEKRLGDQIRAILKHYQQDDPVGLPGTVIPDPLPVPDMKQSISVYTLDLNEIKVYGTSKFRIDEMYSDIALMQVSAALSIETLDICGLYTLSSWLSSTSGNFTVELNGVKVASVARLEVGQNGKLQTQDIDMNLTFRKMNIDFENLGLLGSFFKSVINSVGILIFDTVKFFVMNQLVNTHIRGEVDKYISQLPQYFPNSISPFDMAVAEARHQVAQMGYDPYNLKDYSQSVGIFAVTTTHTWVKGLSTFYRVGNLTLVMENGKVYAGIDVGTQEIEGRSNWELNVVGGVLSRSGTVIFTVEYARVEMNISQPLDTRKKVTLENLDLELGNIETRVHGAGTLDYVAEAGFNVLSNLLRYQIMDAIEGPLMRRIQMELDKVDVEKFIDDNISEIEARVKNLKGLDPSQKNMLGEMKEKLNDDEAKHLHGLDRSEETVSEKPKEESNKDEYSTSPSSESDTELGASL